MLVWMVGLIAGVWGAQGLTLRLWEELRRVWVRYLAGAAKQLVVYGEKMVKRWLRVVITQPP